MNETEQLTKYDFYISTKEPLNFLIKKLYIRLKSILSTRDWCFKKEIEQPDLPEHHHG